MILWELLATTDQWVSSWQHSGPPWPEECRQLYWRDQEDQHRATAVFTEDHRVLALEVIDGPDHTERWIDPDWQAQWQAWAREQSWPDLATTRTRSEILKRFLGVWP